MKRSPGRVPARLLAVALIALPTTHATAQQAPARCTRDMPPFATPFCASLVPVPDLRNASGVLELTSVRSPFGIAVAADGRVRHRITLDIVGLPAPQTLGPYTRYIAWAYTLQMDREVRLGAVGNGRVTLGEVPYEQFRVIVSAEAIARPRERGGRMVMRATSPSALLLAHRDAILPVAARASMEGEHAGHAEMLWPEPPPDARIAPMAMAHTTPSTSPWLPDTVGRNIAPIRAREVLAPHNGDTLTLRAELVRRTIGSRTFVMYGYNGQSPGPLIRVTQGMQVVVRFHNDLDLPSTVHWHGLRLENRFDGVPDLTQREVAPGDSFTYQLRFPDAGIYWYHPHVREDIQQELGLYGNILVARRGQQRVPVHREEILALDDFLMGGSGPLPFGADGANHALMGRFGNQLLVNGEPRYALVVKRGEVVRFYLTNVANARTFNLRIPGARLKLIASDLGDFEREEWVESIIVAPAERYIVEAQFTRTGATALVNSVQWLDHMRGTLVAVEDTLGVITVGEARARPDYSASFVQARPNGDARRELRRMRAQRGLPVRHTLTLSLRVNGLSPLMRTMLAGMPVPLDWNDAMPMMNWALTSKEVSWILRDELGRENMDIQWRFTVGEIVKVRLTNDPQSLHAMAHPIHFHGQRFVVTDRNGVANDNLVWKDTALLPPGESMDILLEVTNPGVWMVHCHVAEHLGAGMMMTFVAAPRG